MPEPARQNAMSEVKGQRQEQSRNIHDKKRLKCLCPTRKRTLLVWEPRLSSAHLFNQRFQNSKTKDHVRNRGEGVRMHLEET
jgi:hypothetical protein